MIGLNVEPGRLLRLNGAIQQRMIGIVQQIFPIFGSDAAGETDSDRRPGG